MCPGDYNQFFVCHNGLLIVVPYVSTLNRHRNTPYLYKGTVTLKNSAWIFRPTLRFEQWAAFDKRNSQLSTLNFSFGTIHHQQAAPIKPNNAPRPIPHVQPTFALIHGVTIGAS